MADLLITNIGMPTERESLNLTILSDGSVIEHFKNESGKWSSYRSGGVKAIEVPTHGRLIDADVIGNRLREQHVFSMPTTCKIDSIIKNAPTVLEATE